MLCAVAEDAELTNAEFNRRLSFRPSTGSVLDPEPKKQSIIPHPALLRALTTYGASVIVPGL